MKPLQKILQTPTALGAIFAAVITVVGTLLVAIIQSQSSEAIAQKQFNNVATIEAATTLKSPMVFSLTTETAFPPTITPTILSNKLLLKEIFTNDESSKWNGNKVFGSMVNFSKSSTYISNGKYYLQLESNNEFTKDISSTNIGAITEKNFCIDFNTQIVEQTDVTTIDILLTYGRRGVPAGAGYYGIELFSNGGIKVTYYNAATYKNQINN